MYPCSLSLHRSLVSAHWEPFHDTQSRIRNYVYFVGSSPNGSDIIPPTVIPAGHTSFLHFLTTPLPSGTQVYATVVGYNRAGLSSKSSSNGVLVDSDLPTLVTQPIIDVEWAGSRFNTSQLSGSVMRIMWNFTDNFSMHRYFVSVESDTRSSLPIPPQSLLNANSAPLSRLMLSDGSRYRVTVIGCDLAGLCISSYSRTPILVDSSPPGDGYFAVASGSVANLPRAVPGGMTWSNLPGRDTARLNLAFLGFLDAHSGIREYWATVGTALSTADLLQPTVLTPSLASNDTYLATASLPRQLVVSESLYISLWAVNGVGLRSHIVQASFRVASGAQANNGSLVLLRSPSCSIDSCLGHCTCAARGQLCNTARETCTTPSTLATNRMLQVYNTVPQLLPSPGPGSAHGPLFTSITDKLYGRWELVDRTSEEIQRTEWSVGIRGTPVSPGAGLIDIADGVVWRDAGSFMAATFSVSERFPVVDGEVYVFHVRAWYSDSEYSVFTSDGVVIDITGPAIVKGSRVRETLAESRDRDFSSDPSALSLSWGGVFSPALSGNFSTYELGIGDVPGSDNIYPLTFVSTGEVSAALSGLTLGRGVGYYSVVRVTNGIGISALSISDGITIDTTPPDVGVVLGGSGLGYKESLAQIDTSILSARWYGFSDVESDIEHYEVAYSNTSSPTTSLVYTDVGIRLQTRLTGLNLVLGQTYYVHVIAVNRAGLRSPVTMSRGVAIQDQRPVGRVCRERSSELLTNPSFENNTLPGVPCPRQLLDVTMATYGWVLDTSYVAVTTLPGTPAADGCFSIGFLGSISQYFPTIPGISHLLSFSYQYPALPLQAAVRVQLPGVQRLLTRPHTESPATWYRAHLEFIPEDTISLLTLSSALSASPVYVDHVTVTRCDQSEILTSTEISITWPTVIRLNYRAISSSRAKLSALWDIVEPVSGIRGYWWAIGSVPGGEQLQAYESTGSDTAATSRELELSDTQEVHVTVVAWSNAGTQTQVHSGAYQVDLTPPSPASAAAVWDGTGELDVDYQDSTIVGVNWSGLVDRESGLDQCSWAIGMHNIIITSIFVMLMLHLYTASTYLANS